MSKAAQSRAAPPWSTSSLIALSVFLAIFVRQRPMHRTIFPLHLHQSPDGHRRRLTIPSCMFTNFAPRLRLFREAVTEGLSFAVDAAH